MLWKRGCVLGLGGCGLVNITGIASVGSAWFQFYSTFIRWERVIWWQ